MNVKANSALPSFCPVKVKRHRQVTVSKTHLRVKAGLNLLFIDPLNEIRQHYLTHRIVVRSRGLLQHNIYSPSPVLRLLHLISSPPLDYSNTVHIWTGLSSMSSMLLEQYIAASLTNASATFPCWLVFIFSPALPLHRCGVCGLALCD